MEDKRGAKRHVRVDGESAVIVDFGADKRLPFNWQMHQEALWVEEHADELTEALKRMRRSVYGIDA